LEDMNFASLEHIVHFSEKQQIERKSLSHPGRESDRERQAGHGGTDWEADEAVLVQDFCHRREASSSQ
jgi:hypothetical protein